jgi:hypothetical protein
LKRVNLIKLRKVQLKDVYYSIAPAAGLAAAPSGLVPAGLAAAPAPVPIVKNPENPETFTLFA